MQLTRRFAGALRASGLAMTGLAAVATVAALGVTTLTSPAVSAQSQADIDEGMAIAFDRQKGNCNSCHMIPGGSFPGNIGPPLVAMKARWPDRQKLRMQIWDATSLNPQSMMPPFGLHGALTEEEIDKVVEFVYSR